MASQTVPMNSMALGVTQLQMNAGVSTATYTVGIADLYGAGRPDFTYTARMLYADSVSPPAVSSGGGSITIAGEGFRQGSQVLVNESPATILSLTATQITARVPNVSSAGATVGQPVNVTVRDQATGGQTTISNALSYANLNVVKLVSAPASLETGVPSSTSFGVRVYSADQTTPVQGASVGFAVQAGSAALLSCPGAASSCTLNTDATGLAQTAVTGHAAGPVSLVATELSGGASQQVTIADTDAVRVAEIATSPAYVASGVPLAGLLPAWTVRLVATEDGTAVGGTPVTWSTVQGLSLSSGASVTDASGTATVSITPQQLSTGTTTVTGCAWGNVCASWTVHAIDSSQWRIAAVSGGGQSVRVGGSLGPVSLLVTDPAGHPLPGANVGIYQTADGWEGVCSAQGRCAASPVLRSLQSAVVADANGLTTVTPLQVPGQPQTVNIAAVTGTEGFISLSLVLTP